MMPTLQCLAGCLFCLKMPNVLPVPLNFGLLLQQHVQGMATALALPRTRHQQWQDWYIEGYLQEQQGAETALLLSSLA